MRRWMPGMFAVLLGADEVMKQYVEDYMEPGEERRIAGGKLLLRRIHNPGFALGTLEDQPKIVRNVSVAAAVPVFAWWLSLIWRTGSKRQEVPLQPQEQPGTCWTGCFAEKW